jgi:hypothetical protein
MKINRNNVLAVYYADDSMGCFEIEQKKMLAAISCVGVIRKVVW